MCTLKRGAPGTMLFCFSSEGYVARKLLENKKQE